jgi:hypothetical protein
LLRPGPSRDPARTLLTVTGLDSHTETGHLVTHKRPKASDVIAPTLTCLDGGRSALDGPRLLTRAEAHALRRSAIHTHAQLAEYLSGLPEPPPRSA